MRTPPRRRKREEPPPLANDHRSGTRTGKNRISRIIKRETTTIEGRKALSIGKNIVFRKKYGNPNICKKESY